MESNKIPAIALLLKRANQAYCRAGDKVWRSFYDFVSASSHLVPLLITLLDAKRPRWYSHAKRGNEVRLGADLN